MGSSFWLWPYWHLPKTEKLKTKKQKIQNRQQTNKRNRMISNKQENLNKPNRNKKQSRATGNKKREVLFMTLGTVQVLATDWTVAYSVIMVILCTTNPSRRSP